jgi:cyclopropane fatty-acyl-phospholipid synthase-like methyltransferase
VEVQVLSSAPNIDLIMKKNLTAQQRTARYYSRPTSRLGYRFVMKRSQHFGYYDAKHQDETSAQAKYHQEFTKLLELEPGMKVLDAGCGQGVVACYLAEKTGAHITGITITPYEVASATKRAQKLGVSDLTTFMLADYADPPFEPASFDRIYTTETLCHAPDVFQVIEKLFSLLKPGGMVVFAEYVMDHTKFDDFMRKYTEFVKERAGIYGIYQFGPGEFKGYLKKAGLQGLTVLDWTKHISPSIFRLQKMASPSLPLVNHRFIRKYFINAVAAEMYGRGVKQGLFEYQVYIAHKP